MAGYAPDNDIIYRKALKSVSFVLDEFSQIANIEPKLTTYWHKKVNNLEMRIYDNSWRETTSTVLFHKRRHCL